MSACIRALSVGRVPENAGNEFNKRLFVKLEKSYYLRARPVQLNFGPNQIKETNTLFH